MSLQQVKPAQHVLLVNLRELEKENISTTVELVDNFNLLSTYFIYSVSQDVNYLFLVECTYLSENN